MGWLLAVGLLTETLTWLHRAELGTGALSLMGVNWDALWLDTEVVDAHVATVVSSGPWLITAGSMGYEEQ